MNGPDKFFAHPDGATRLACFHCGQPVEPPLRWTVTIDGIDRPMCCAGCEAVASTIAAAGLADYYKHRSAPADIATDPQAALAELSRLGLYDDPQVQQQFSRTVDDGVECSLAIEGMRCGACVWLLERTLRAQPGVLAASVNFATERATLRWSPQATQLSTLLARLRAIGYKALPFDARTREDQLARASRTLFRRLFVAGLGMMQVMMYAVPAYTAGPSGIDPEYVLLMQWASFVLTVPVVLYSAAPFFAGAWRDLRNRRPGMDTPVALGVAAAFAASTWATISRHGEVYFDSVTMFVFLLLLARYLEWQARQRASRAVDGLAASTPDSITRVNADGSHELLAAVRAQVGDVFLVGTGDRFAVDATLLDGPTSIDQSLLTGESVPVGRISGDEIAGGSVNAGPPVQARVLRDTRASAPSMVQQLIDRAGAEKPRMASLADQVASWFVAGLLVFATATFAWWLAHDAQRALPIAIAVLVVSCPCALSLATPAALAAATGSLLKGGLLITRGHALEALADITDVVFDKTGTLTRGDPQLVAQTTLAGFDPGRALALAAALETGSAHPFARALRRAAAGEPPAATELASMPGMGVAGSIDGQRYRLGSIHHVCPPAGQPVPSPDARTLLAAGDAGDSLVWLGSESADGTLQAIACFALRDQLRDDATVIVAQLRAGGLRVHLLSGDREPAVALAARQLGLADFRGDARPHDKLAYLKTLQQQGRRVLMVGDGINDGPVLAAADVSIAVSDATNLARVAADLVSVRPGLAQVARALQMGRRTRTIIFQNLAWASVYNLLAIPAAALGWVPPWVAAIGMSVSSLIVALNASRLWSWNRSTC